MKNVFEQRTILALFFVLLGLLCSEKAYSQSGLYRLKTICIDAGHGGKDPGTVGKHVYEKDVVLSVALKLGKLIESQHKDIKIVYTRSKDVFIPLFKRAEIANKHDADLFISIHANGVDNKRVYGTETFVFGLNKTNANLKVAMKENGVIKYEDDYNTKYAGFNPSKPESYIMFNMVQNHHREQSIELANYVERFFKNSGRKSRGVQESSLIVLIKAAMPAVLVELGFVSNAKEEKLLMSKRGQSKLVSDLFKAFEKYKQKVEKKSNIVDKSDNSIIFGVQIASASKKIKNSALKKFLKFGQIKEYYHNKRYRYYISADNKYSQVIGLQREIRKIQKGCFIIALNKGKKISVSKARELVNL